MPLTDLQHTIWAGDLFHKQTSICRYLIHKKCRNPTKDSCTKKHTCDPLSPYVGIIQIRFRVKAYAYSQPACASTPFFCFPHHFCDGLFYNSFIIHTCSQNASFFYINCCCHCHIYGNCMCREPISSATVSSLSCQVFWYPHLY